MAMRFDELKSTSEPNRTASNTAKEGGEFECSICFDLPQDPIVTLCGHLFCWPCLYKWLYHHSQSQECPVCKALIQQEKLVPIYGRGKTTIDPRSKQVPGFEIPSRSSGHRPATVPSPPNHNYSPDNRFGLLRRYIPGVPTNIGGGFLYAAMLELPIFFMDIPRLSSFQWGSDHDMIQADEQQTTMDGRVPYSFLKGLFLFAGFFVILTLCSS